MTVKELIDALEDMPDHWDVQFSDDNGITLVVDPLYVPEGDQEWQQVTIHVTEKE